MRWYGVLLVLGLMATAVADELSLTVATRTGQGQTYYHDLLVAALAKAGVQARLNPVTDMPNVRIEQMLEQGQLGVHWFLRTAERDKRFLRVSQGLTGGMIGWRILMVPPADVADYASMRTLADLRRSRRVAAMAFGWADATIWQHNGLPAIQQRFSVGELYRQVASGKRGVHYFPRGSIEVAAEHDLRAGLVPLPGIVLIYPQDFYFYVSPAMPQLHAKLQLAMQQAEQSGLRQKLFRQYYGTALSELALDKRVQIHLSSPP